MTLILALTFAEYDDELGPVVRAFGQLEQDTFRPWNSRTYPAGRSLVVLVKLWNGQRWLTLTDADAA